MISAAIPPPPHVLPTRLSLPQARMKRAVMFDKSAFKRKREISEVGVMY